MKNVIKILSAAIMMLSLDAAANTTMCDNNCNDSLSSCLTQCHGGTCQTNCNSTHDQCISNCQNK